MQHTLQSRARLAESVRANWRRKDYREKVVSGLRDYYDDPLNSAIRTSKCKRGHAKHGASRCKECHKVDKLRYAGRVKMWDGILMEALRGLS